MVKLVLRAPKKKLDLRGTNAINWIKKRDEKKVLYQLLKSLLHQIEKKNMNFKHIISFTYFSILSSVRFFNFILLIVKKPYQLFFLIFHLNEQAKTTFHLLFAIQIV